MELNKLYIPQKIKSLKKEITPITTSRFTEASLIKELKRLKIACPSTYSKIIETLKKCFYVEIKDKEFVCTERGISIVKLLDKFFPSIINTHYTVQIEQQLDDIYNGKIDRITLLKDFYNQFEQFLLVAKQNIKKTPPVMVKYKCSLCNDFLIIIRKGSYCYFLCCSKCQQCKNIVSLKEKTNNPKKLMKKNNYHKNFIFILNFYALIKPNL
ncbi:DNA topoisomerase I [Candidatus Phytoplasma phoenicium]|uniref:DNA topoisomerase I n=1 Tax=Candidatus Phytoplasma phoenicium TaxID=198422 RepID=A0A0L0MKE2_9MOLU|nr:DNA topoisomerase I [Candidatus Phytoplasma phoenicium]